MYQKTTKSGDIVSVF